MSDVMITVCVVGFVAALIFFLKILPMILKDKKTQAENKKTQAREQALAEEKSKLKQAIEDYKKRSIEGFKEWVKGKNHQPVIDKTVKAEFGKAPELIENTPEIVKLLNEFSDDAQKTNESGCVGEIIRNFTGTSNANLKNYYKPIKENNVIRAIYRTLRDASVETPNFALSFPNEYYESSSNIIDYSQYSKFGTCGKDRKYTDDYFKQCENKIKYAKFIKENGMDGFFKSLGNIKYIEQNEMYKECFSQKSEIEKINGIIAMQWAQTIDLLIQSGSFDKKILTGTVKDAGINLAKCIEKIDLITMGLEYGYFFDDYQSVPDVLKKFANVCLIKIALHVAACNALLNGLTEKDIEPMFKSDFFTKARRNELEDLLSELLEHDASTYFVTMGNVRLDMMNIVAIANKGY